MFFYKKNADWLFYGWLSLLLLSGIRISQAGDWPQWRGPLRNGSSEEKNLLKKWPEKGPELLWSAENLGAGFSSASVSGGRIYLTGVIEDRETLTALDFEGNVLWRTTYGDKWKGSYPEARTTPTVENNRIYVISGMGKAACFDSKTGQIVWDRDVFEEFDGDYHSWGIAESPLIVDDKLICTPGGSEASVVALDKINGKVIWQTADLDEQSNYCSPILINRGSKKIIATQLADSFVGIKAEDGSLCWRDAYDQYQDDPKDININSPLYHDGSVFVTSGYDNPSAQFKIADHGLSVQKKMD